MKEFSKSVNICRSYGELSTELFFMKHRVDMDDMVDMTCASCHRYQVAVHATMLYGCTSKQSKTVKPRFIL